MKFLDRIGLAKSMEIPVSSGAEHLKQLLNFKNVGKRGLEILCTPILLVLFLTCSISMAFSQEMPDSLEVSHPSVFHISSHAFFGDGSSEGSVDTLSFDFGDLLILSLVSEELFAHWHEEKDRLSRMYTAEEVVIVVSPEDTADKEQFVLELYIST